MEFKHFEEVDNKVLFITTDGQGPSLEEVKKFSVEMFEHCLLNSCTKILADDRNQTNVLTDLELYELGEFHASHMPAIIKMAVVTSSKDMNKIKLWENTAYNRGRNVKIFKDIELAKKWLNGEE